jgi:hypothetical protein
MLASCVETFFSSAPAEPFFRPGPHDAAAVVRIPMKSATDSDRSRPPVPIEAGQ